MNFTFKSRQYSHRKIAPRVQAILTKSQLWSMATVRSAAQSYINTAYFCYNDDFVFYSLSDSLSQHARNSVRSSHASVAIFDSHQSWGADHRGLQMFGRCREATTREAATALVFYAARFPEYARYIKDLSTSESAASTYRFYVFRPTTIKLFDESAFDEEEFVIAKVVRGR